MEEIKVGEYIRTVQGKISKVTDTDVGETAKGDVKLIELDKKEYTEIGSWIKKHSFDIIDLIEERRLFRWCKS